MIPTTQTVRDNFMASHHQVMRITMGNTTITDANIIVGGFIIDSYSVSGERIEIGSAIASELTLKLANFSGDFSAVDFEGQEMFVELGIADWDAGDTPVYIPMGYFTCDEQPKNRSVIEVKALDRMTKFDVPVDWTLFTFPCTLQSMVTAVCTEVGVALGTTFSSLPNASYVIDYSPETSVTYRDIIRWAGFLTGTCARIDENGYLKFVWYTSSGITIDPSNRYSHQLEESDITITGVYYNGSGVEYLAGTANYAVEFYDCHILQNNIETAIGNILTAVSGFTYRSFEAVIQSAPFLQPMDTIAFEDKDGNDHTCIITHMTYTGNQSTPIKGVGETPKEASYANLSGLTAQQSVVVDDARKQATNYLSADRSGIMVADMTDGRRYTPDDVPEGVKNTFIDSNSFDVRDGTRKLASFGEVSQVGSDDSNRMVFNPLGVRTINQAGESLFAIEAGGVENYKEYTPTYTLDTQTPDIDTQLAFSDLTFENGKAEFQYTVTLEYSDETSEEHTGVVYAIRGTGSSFDIFDTDGGKVTLEYVYSNNEESAELTSSFSFPQTDTPHVTNMTINLVIRFYTSINEPAFALGSRTGSKGGFSAVIGEGLRAQSYAQFACGSYNAWLPDYLLMAGNGTEEGGHSNAFAVTREGDVRCCVNPDGWPDTDLYGAITALGWENDVLDYNDTELSLKKILTKIMQAVTTTTATGTIGTATVIQNADRQYCFLKKTGKQVRCYMGIGYNNGTTQLGSTDTLFTVPDGYRPAVRKQVAGIIYRASGTTIIANVRIDTDGTIVQTSYQNATMVYMVAEWETA